MKGDEQNITNVKQKSNIVCIFVIKLSLEVLNVIPKST